MLKRSAESKPVASIRTGGMYWNRLVILRVRRSLDLPTSPVTHSAAPNSFPLYMVPSFKIKLACFARFDDIFSPLENCQRGWITISHTEKQRNLARDLFRVLVPSLRTSEFDGAGNFMAWKEAKQCLSEIFRYFEVLTRQRAEISPFACQFERGGGGGGRLGRKDYM